MRVLKTIIVILLVCIAAGALTSCGKKNSGEVVAEEDSGSAVNNVTDEKQSGKDGESDSRSDADVSNDVANGNNSGSNDAGTKKDKVDMKALAEECIAADSSLPAMLTVDSSFDDAARQFAFISDVEYDLVDSFFLAYSESGLADEIVVVKMKNSADTASMQKSLEEHIDDRIKMFSSYQADQVSRVENNTCYSSNEYVVLIICDGKNKVRKVIDNHID